MYASRSGVSAVGGLVPTGHTFSVGSEACIGCHKDTVHTRDTILALSGERAQSTEADPEELKKEIQDLQSEVGDLKVSSTVRLYVGLAQGAIVGLIVGGVAAWIVSRRLKVVEIEEDE
jgi:hypothetical protein